MVANQMKERGTSVRQLAKQLDVTEGALRYRLGKLGREEADGRASQPTALDGLEEAVVAIQERLGDGRLTGEGRPCQVRQIYEALVRDHAYGGSLKGRRPASASAARDAEGSGLPAGGDAAGRVGAA